MILKELLDDVVRLRWLENDLVLWVLGHFILLLALSLLLTAPFVIYLALGRPLKRAERAGLFLDLLASGLERGRTPESIVAEWAECPDPSLGNTWIRLHQSMASGRSLPEALKEMPSLLPPQVVGFLQVGTHAGDLLPAVLACRRMLNDSRSQTLGASHALPILTSVMIPILPFLFLTVRLWIGPKYGEIVGQFVPSSKSLPTVVETSLVGGGWFALFSLITILLFYCLALFYIGGPSLRRWIQPDFFPVIDWAAWFIPWRRTRLLRDFLSSLAILLDAGAPEAEAVRLAGEACPNLILQRRSRKVVDRLSKGVPLIEALRGIDPAREFQWRFANGWRGSGRGGDGNPVNSSRAPFTENLKGWFEALDLRAQQQEQNAAQIWTSGLVVFNGVMVGWMAVGLFQGLLLVMDSQMLW